ncbi:MAG: prepilin-type N-terminal cleavage/methylation domain-containing protein [Candidatus Omnitrophica bacterium]|nr:prepilin-type N-terminal cleavage/methylation domain-containing protein [Candidatus Omnitrophota bacterium]
MKIAKGFTPPSVKPCSLARRAGFTLIELIVVMAIIIILAGAVSGTSQIARKKALTSKTKAAISSLETALSMYETDCGVFPPSGNSNMVSELIGPSTQTGWNGPYMTFKSSELSGGAFIDPWGSPYVYTNPGAHNTSSVDIYSLGPNKTDESGTGDDINNW